MSGEELTFRLPSGAFKETNVVALIVKSQEGNVIRFRVEKLKDLPSEIPRPKDKTVLTLSIEPTFGREGTVTGRIQFGIKIDDIKAAGFDPNAVEVVMLRWHENRWEELPTKFLSSDGTYNYYEAETPGFSYFVAVLKPLELAATTTSTTAQETQTATATTVTAEKPKPFTPGFEGFLAIAGLAAVAYLLRRR